MGKIEVICGPMFSGKSEELLRRLKRADIAKRKSQLFKPECDKRYSETEVATHSGQKRKCEIVEKNREEEILKAIYTDTEVVALDEAQFFGDYITNVALTLSKAGKRVIVAGLDMDSNGDPFGPIPQLLAVAEDITKLTAVCEICGDPATHSYRKSKSKKQVLVGAATIYEARCRNHWQGV
tara:strand:+ start:1799 stop:2341 length:543 start_codon:yes stop_codon:yes gene_type:complete